MRSWPKSVYLVLSIAPLLLATSALAGPFKETLPRSERIAIEEAIQNALPPVDKAAVAQCKANYDAGHLDPQNDPDTVAAAAACYRAAGSLGVAITLWDQVRIKAPRAKIKPEMVRDLAVAREAAAQFEDAARTYADYLSLYYDQHRLTAGGQTPKDAAEVLTRVTCIDRQLGDERGARAATERLQRLSKTTIDPETLCDHVRPIAMPTPPPSK